MVYTVDRLPDYQWNRRERNAVRKVLQNPSRKYSANGLMKLYRYMIQWADNMSELENAWQEAQD